MQDLYQQPWVNKNGLVRAWQVEAARLLVESHLAQGPATAPRFSSSPYYRIDLKSHRACRSVEILNRPARGQ